MVVVRVVNFDDPDRCGKHTLVIPTFNRPALLKKLIQYYRDRASWIDLLILDSSRSDIAQQNAKAMSIYASGVSHVVFPEDVVVVSKLSDGLQLVRTPYVSFCGDDDLVFPNGLCQAISFLHGHLDYVSAHGLYLNFRSEGRDIFLSIEYAAPGIEAAHSGARVFRLCQKYESLFYAVFRIADAREIITSLNAVSTIHFQELFQSVAAVTIGKVKRLPVIYGARRSGPPAQEYRDKWQTYSWFADDPAELLAHYRIYSEMLWKFYQAHAPEPQSSQHEFLRMLDLAHAVYFASGCPPDYFYSKLRHLWPHDPYLRVGRLDALQEASRLVAVKRALLPHKQQEMDVLDQLRLSSDTRDWTSTGMAGGIRFLWQCALACMQLARLNSGGRVAAGEAWRCRLPKPLIWMAGNPSFRDAYFELRYCLGRPAPPGR